MEQTETLFSVLEIDLSASFIIAKHSTLELQLQPNKTTLKEKNEVKALIEPILKLAMIMAFRYFGQWNKIESRNR
jgi:hypothetical protein